MSKIKVREGLVSGKDLRTASLCPHMAEGVRELSGISYKGTDPILEGFTLMT